MKTALAITVLALLAWLGWRSGWPGGEPPPSAAAPGTARIHDPPNTVIRDGAEVFRRAFWKHSSTADRILHAERREWSEGEGVEKWQWFLVLRPSPQLVKYLREDNPFSLTAGSSPDTITAPPAWFSFTRGEVEILRSPRGDMQLIFGQTDNLLYATASGGGFTKPAEK